MNVVISMPSHLYFYIVGASGRKADRILGPIMGLNCWSPFRYRQYPRRINVSNHSVVNLMPVRWARWQSSVFVFLCDSVVPQPLYLCCLQLLSKVQKAACWCDKPEEFRQRFCSWAECFSLKHNWRWNTCIQWPSIIESWEVKNWVCLVQF